MSNWNQLKVFELKAELKERDLPTTGLKADLVARLDEDDAMATLKSDDDHAPDLAKAEDAPTADEDDAAAVLDDAPVTAADVVPTPSIEPAETISEPAPEATNAPAPVTAADVVQTPSIEPAETISEPAPEATNAPAPEEIKQNEEAAKAEVPPVIDEAAAEAAIPELAKVDARELTADIEKRKRRSCSPPPAYPNDAAKRQKLGEDTKADSDGVVETTQDDAKWVQEHNNVDTAAVNEYKVEVAAEGGVKDGLTIVDTAKEDVFVEQAAGSLPAPPAEDIVMGDVEQETRSPEDHKMDDATPAQYDDRSRSRSPKRERTRSRSPQRSPINSYRERSPVRRQSRDDGRTVSPAIHPATSALYIRDFQRPLNKHDLQDHVTTLASAPGQSPNPDLIVNFFLDGLCTHSFIEFVDVKAASRVRSEIHGRVWPEGEKNRKELWADFIPDTNVREWIDIEKESQAKRERRKWEVVYEPNGDGELVAALQEAVAVPAQQIPRGPGGGREAPRGPRADRMMGGMGMGGRGMPMSGVNDMPIGGGVPTGPRGGMYGGRGGMDPGPRDSQSSTYTLTTPSLQFVPVAKPVVETRLAHLQSLYSPDAETDPSRASSEKHRYTFDRETLVDRGVEVFEGVRKPAGVRRMPLPPDVTGGGRLPRGRGRRNRSRDRYGGDRYGGRDGGRERDGPVYRDYRDGPWDSRDGARGPPPPSYGRLGGGGGGGGGGGRRGLPPMRDGDRWRPDDAGPPRDRGGRGPRADVDAGGDPNGMPVAGGRTRLGTPVDVYDGGRY